MPETKTEVKVKEYKQSEFLRKMLPVLNKDQDATFNNTATRLAYMNEIIFTVATATVLINILVSNKQFLRRTHSLRATILFLVAGLSVMAIVRGHSMPIVNIYFYLAECLIVVGIIVAGLVLESIKLAQTPDTSHVIAVVIMIGFLLFNGYFLVKTLYRLIKLKKTVTPINNLMTLANAIIMGVMSVRSVYQNKEPTQQQQQQVQVSNNN